MTQRYIVQRQYGEWCVMDAHAHINVTIAVGCPIGQGGTEAGREYAERIAHGLNSRDALLALIRDMSDAISWYTSFYHDVQNTTPEYFELCGDANAAQYLYTEAQAIQERARVLLGLGRTEATGGGSDDNTRNLPTYRGTHFAPHVH